MENPAIAPVPLWDRMHAALSMNASLVSGLVSAVPFNCHGGSSWQHGHAIIPHQSG